MCELDTRLGGHIHEPDVRIIVRDGAGELSGQALDRLAGSIDGRRSKRQPDAGGRETNE